jgi:type II secretory pathway pseudopilin PulG
MRSARSSEHRLPPDRAGRFTLVELLAVIFLLAVLMALVAGGTRLAWRKAEEGKIKARFKTLQIGLQNYQRDWGYFPLQGTPGEFRILLYSPDERLYLQDQPRLSDNPVDLPNYHKPQDAYRQSGSGSEPFRYEYPGTHNPDSYDLWAPGVDGTSGSDDDISNWGRTD